MIDTRNSIAMAETINYLKGIKQEDIEKIPQKLINFLNENASKEYICNFDYNKPLNELQLLDETRGIIGMICYNYWCTTQEQKLQYLKKVRKNEQRYQNELKKIYNPNDIFNNKNMNLEKEIAMKKYKEKFWVKLKKRIIKLLNFKSNK